MDTVRAQKSPTGADRSYSISPSVMSDLDCLDHLNTPNGSPMIPWSSEWYITDSMHSLSIQTSHILKIILVIFSYWGIIVFEIEI